MAPRIANDCFPEEFLTVDYDHTMVPGAAPLGGGGGGATHHAAAGDIAFGEMHPDGDDEEGQAAAAAVAAAMADAAQLDAGAPPPATAGAMPPGGSPHAIENDPLSMSLRSLGRPTAPEQPRPSLGRSRSSASGGAGDPTLPEGIATAPSGGTAHTLHTTHTGNGPDGQGHAGAHGHHHPPPYATTTVGAADTTITVSIANAAQQAWDQFVAGQEAAAAHAGPTPSPPSHAQAGLYSPSSIPPPHVPPTTHFITPTGHGPASYQPRLLQQRLHASHSDDARTPQQHGPPGPRPASHAHHPQALQGRPVPRASSFGGFPNPPRGASFAGGVVVAEGAPLASTPEHFPAAVVARSHSVMSSLTHSATRGPSDFPNSVASGHDAGGSTYQRFLSTVSTLSPVEAIPPSEAEESAGSGPQDSPQDTHGSLHSAGGFSSPPAASSPDGSQPGAGGGSVGSLVKLPYSPSLLDQTSFPEEEDLSVVGDDEGGDDKYLPVAKLDWHDGYEGDPGMDTTADTTADTTYEDASPDHGGDHHGPGLLSAPGGPSQGLATHIIHEDFAMATHVAAPLPATTLRPRPQAFVRADSSSSGATAVSHEGVVPVSAEGAIAGASPHQPPRRRSARHAAHPQPPRPQYRHQISDVSVASHDGSVQLHVSPPPLSFGTETTIADLTYYAEKGCIVDVLAALTNPHLKTLGSRMLADYAKMPHRRVAVASNTSILEFVQDTALEIGVAGHPHYQPLSAGTSHSSGAANMAKYVSPSWLGREYAVETVRSLTAAEENDRYLMNAPGLLQTLALVARGGPFVRYMSSRSLQQSYESHPMVMAVSPPTYSDNGSPGPRLMADNTMALASDKARLHACIAIMNLSCGKSNKIEITGVKEILEAMRDVMLGRHFSNPPRDSSSVNSSGSNGGSLTNVADEARLKATTCIKNLSNADANDAALLATPGLVETLGYVAEATCHPVTGATTCTTHACLALMNLSISKANKNRVFRTPGVMDALMAVITRTAPREQSVNSSEPQSGSPKDPNFEARVKACSALSNLAIGYDNKIPMFNYPGFVESILTVIRSDKAEARTKACSILWSFAAEMKNQVPVVQRGDILPALVSVAKEDTKTEARFKCVAALTLLAESPENAVPLLQAGSLEPLMNVLQEAGPDPTQWRGQTASWCVGFLMNMAQCDDVVPALLQEGIVDLLAPLLSLDHYQSLKAAMAVTFVCQYDTGDKTYNLLRQTENVIPKIVGLLHNTLSGRGGSGYKYGVFTLRSSVGCIASLAAGPDFMKERIATNPVFESLLKVVEDFCVDQGTPGAIVGGGKDDTRSVTLAIKALSLLVGHLIPEPNCAAMPFGPAMDDKLIIALRSFELNTHCEIDDHIRSMARDARIRIEGGRNLHGHRKDSVSSDSSPDDLSDDGGGIGLSLARRFFPFPCGMNLHVPSDPAPSVLPLASKEQDNMDVSDDSSGGDASAVRTFLLTDEKTGRRFAVPCDPAGGRQFNDNRVWCFRRGRFCNEGELPDPNFPWSDELQVAYKAALNGNATGPTSQD